VLTPPVLILAVGNQLMRDEGVGPRVAAELWAHYELPETVEVMDAGTLGLGMLHVLRDREYVLIVDAIDGTGHPAGTVVRTSPADFAPNQILHSLHDVRLVDVLQAAELMGVSPETECVGVQIEDISPPDFSVDLTAAVEVAVPRAVAATLYILAERGVEIPPLAGEEHTVFTSQVDVALEDMRHRLGGSEEA
jgi:hydrogenase maturation protease